jgi:hypothetical protein
MCWDESTSGYSWSTGKHPGRRLHFRANFDEVKVVKSPKAKPAPKKKAAAIAPPKGC